MAVPLEESGPDCEVHVEVTPDIDHVSVPVGVGWPFTPVRSASKVID